MANKKNKPAAGTAPEQSPAVSAELEALKAKLEVYQQALEAKALELAAMRVGAAGSTTEPMVVLENIGYKDVVINLEPGADRPKCLVLTTQGGAKMGSLPLSMYTQLVRTSSIFDKGLVRVVGEPASPNAIPEAANWIAAVEEAEIDTAVGQLTSEGAIHVLWNYLETKTDFNGKDLMVKRALRKRASELFSYDLVEDQ